MDKCKNCDRELGNFKWHLTEKSTGNKFCNKSCADSYKIAALTEGDSK